MPAIALLFGGLLSGEHDARSTLSKLKSYTAWLKYHSQSVRNLLRKTHLIPERGVQMKKVLLGGVVALGMSVPAMAADMAARPMARPAAFTNWSGCYLGGDAGFGFGHSDGYSTTAASTFLAGTVSLSAVTAAPGIPLTNGFNMSGLIGGAYGGCQVQFGVWVVGAEGDFSAFNKEGQAFLIGGPNLNTIATNAGTTTIPAGLYWSAKERWLATARGRLGYAVDKWLFSVSGGAAWAKIDSAESTTGGAGFVTVPLSLSVIQSPISSANLQSDYRLGWTVGAAAEYMLPYNWTIRAEYLFVQIPSYTTFTPGTNRFALFEPTNVTAGKLTNNIVRFGLAYNFPVWGKAAPAVTK
jgi:outer membrane immunogenic protein